MADQINISMHIAGEDLDVDDFTKTVKGVEVLGTAVDAERICIQPALKGHYARFQERASKQAGTIHSEVPVIINDPLAFAQALSKDTLDTFKKIYPGPYLKGSQRHCAVNALRRAYEDCSFFKTVRDKYRDKQPCNDTETKP